MVMKHSSRLSSTCLFFLGLGSATKVYLFGCIAISELVVFFLAPIVFLCVFREMRRRGFAPFIYMCLATMCAMFLSAKINLTPFPYVFKTFALMYSVMAYYVVFYALVRKALRNGLWLFFLGAALSSIVTIYAFNPTAQVSESGFAYVAQSDMEDIINGPLFWIQKIKDFGQLPIIAVYLPFPIVYSFVAPIAFTVFAMLTSVSGRSASLSILLFAVMVMMGRKSRRSMRMIGRHFFLFVLIGLSVVVVYKSIYQYAARQGFLGNNAQTKYESQTRGGTAGLLRLLMSGRKEFFIAIPAALDKPIFGHGPFAVDRKGYAVQFLSKYGEPEDFNQYNYYQHQNLLYGYLPKIPTHSHILGAWVHYGLMGLVFWIWILYLIFCHLRHYAAAIPQWYGYFALMISGYLWHIFFSPFGSRSQFALFAVCLFFARAIGQGRMQLPYDMEMQARKYE